MKNHLLCAALIACIGVTSISHGAGAAPAGQARVATGAKVPLVASTKTADEWSARRPQFRELRPKVRGTMD